MSERDEARVHLCSLSAIADLRERLKGCSGIYPEREAEYVAHRWLIPMEAAREIVQRYIRSESAPAQGRLELGG